MAGSFSKIMVIQTAFIGDAILTLPLIQALKMNYPHSSIDVTVIPRTAEIFDHHPGHRLPVKRDFFLPLPG